MASEVESLEAIKATIITKIAESYVSPKPSYSIDGQSVSWNAYRTSLLSELKQINDLIYQADPNYEFIEQAYT